MAPIFPLVRDRDGGEVVVGRDGQPSARYRISRYDLRHLRAGFLGAARILEAAGAKRIVSTHAKPVVWQRGAGGIGRFPRRRGRAWLGAEPRALRVRARDGNGADGRLAGDLRVRPERGSMGGLAARRLRRLGVPDGVWCEPDGDDRRPRAHERVGARRTPLSILGIDVGGTFTDAVLLVDGELRTAKVPTRHARRSRSSRRRAPSAPRTSSGSRTGRPSRRTRCSNARAHERRSSRTRASSTSSICGARRARISTASARRIPSPLVPLDAASACAGAPGPDGELEPLDLSSLASLDAEAVAVCLLHSYRFPEHERAVSAEIRRLLPDAHVVASHELAPSSASTSARRRRPPTRTSAL
jgi:hypothetical protein